MTNHNHTQPLAEEKITLPSDHILTKLTPIGLVLGIIGLVALFGLSASYSSFWTAPKAHHGGKAGHASKKHGKKHHAKAGAHKHAKGTKHTHAKKGHGKKAKAAAAKGKKAHAKKAHGKKGHGKKAHAAHAAHGHHHVSKPQIWGSYLVAFLFFLTISLGAFFFVLIHFATRAGWSASVRRMAEFVIGALPFLALLFIPFYLFGRGTMYHHWLVPDVTDAVLSRKLGFLNEKFFTVRAILYFLFWVLVATWYSRQSMLQDRIGGEEITRKMQKWSYICLFLFAWTTTFAAFDWVMSIDPHWYSTIFGVYFFAGCVVSLHSFLAIMIIMFRRMGFLNGIVTTEHDHDLGKMMYGFNIFWTYAAFSQFMLIWYSNIPEETMWYQYRINGQWSSLSIFLVLGHFVFPFFFLMSRHIKRNQFTLFITAVWMLIVHFADMYWLVMPTLYNGHGGTVQFKVVDLLPLAASFVAIGGFFLAGFGWWMRKNYLIARRDPRLQESIAFQNF